MVSFTVVKGGERKNVIPDYAEADADVRAPWWRRSSTGSSAISPR